MYVCTSMQMKLNATPTPHKHSVIVVHGNVYVHTQEKKNSAWAGRKPSGDKF